MEVEILKYPTQEDWKWVKTCTLNTVGKTSVKDPTIDWERKLLKAEHSPIRELWFGIKMKVPYYVMGHFVRHHIGCNHYVQTQRDDRTNNPVPRAEPYARCSGGCAGHRGGVLQYISGHSGLSWRRLRPSGDEPRRRLFRL